MDFSIPVYRTNVNNMKRVFFLLVLAFVVSVGNTFAQTKRSECPKRIGWWCPNHIDVNGDIPLYGDIESVTIVTYALKDRFGEIVRSEYQTRKVFFFNSAGNVTQEYDYNSQGILEKHVYKYDSAGNKTERAFYMPGDKFDSKFIYNYDSVGNVTECAHYDFDGSLLGKDIYKYDSVGNVTECASYDSDGSLHGKEIYKYDPAGNLIEESSFLQPSGTLHSQSLYSYDFDGYLVEEKNCFGWYSYKYDVAGNKTETFINGELWAVYKYDSLGNRIGSTTYRKDGSLFESVVCKYDSVGNLIESTCYVSPIMIPSSQYEYIIVYRDK